jgi:hypothetical protein
VCVGVHVKRGSTFGLVPVLNRGGIPRPGILPQAPHATGQSSGQHTQRCSLMTRPSSTRRQRNSLNGG